MATPDGFFISPEDWPDFTQLLRDYRAGLLGAKPRHQAKPTEFNQEIAYVAKTGSAIAARSGDTPGSGTVTLYDIDGDGDYYSLEVTRTAYNASSVEVAADTYIHIKFCGTHWEIDFESCEA